MIEIRKAVRGDEPVLAYIQTGSWKAAFRDIVPEDLLSELTDAGRAEEMYTRILEQEYGTGYILELDGKPHCIAWWAASRDAEMDGYAELICIHSLQDNWHKGYGSRMMERVVTAAAAAGYRRIMLWVFEENIRAKRFYESHGFNANGRKQPAFGSVEEMYVRSLTGMEDAGEI